MSARSATIYVEPRTIKRLRLLLKLYPQYAAEDRGQGTDDRRRMADDSPLSSVISPRSKTADEVADALINDAITTNYPLVKDLEKLLQSTEKTFMAEYT